MLLIVKKGQAAQDSAFRDEGATLSLAPYLMGLPGMVATPAVLSQCWHIYSDLSSCSALEIIQASFFFVTFTRPFLMELK